MQGIAILGSTGSIGRSALRVIERHPDKFKVIALTAYENGELLEQQAKKFKPQFVGLVSANGKSHENGWEHGSKCLIDAATHAEADIVLNAVVGAAGLQATLAAVRTGKRVALANKESLVLGGELVIAACREGKGDIIPVDSEHSAILQCISGESRSDISRIILTASGGPFRGYTPEQLEKVTVQDALKHPTWSMGRKISVDSATLANKALEVIEAHYLFDVPYDSIEVVVHPQSLVHSFVEFVDGSILAQVGVPSMELPILYALSYPNRLEDMGVPRFDPLAYASMTFEPVSMECFPSLKLGISAGRHGGSAPAIFNAANEIAVARFLEGSFKFSDIPGAIELALNKFSAAPGITLEERLEADRQARDFVRSL